MPFVRDCLHIYKEMTGRAQTLRFCGPFTLAAQCMQFEQLILQIQENPDFVHKVFRFLVEEVQAPYLNALFKDFPEAGTNGSDAIGSLPFLTEKILDEFSIPYILRLRELCGGNPKVQVDNWWGDSFAENAERFWEKKLIVTPAYLKIQDPDLFRVGTQRARAFADTLGCPLQFGVDNHVLQRGPVEEITKRVHEYMEVGTSGPHGKNFCLYLCSLSAQTPTEHVTGTIDAVNRFRAGDRPYAGQVLSGASEESTGRPGDRGYWMGIGSVEDLKKNFRETLEEESKAGKKEIFQEIYDAVMAFEHEECATLVTRALDQGETPAEILDEALIAAMDTIGDLFSSGVLFVPEMLLSAKAMKAGLAILRPILTATKEPPQRGGDPRDCPRRPPRYRKELGRDDARGGRIPGLRPRGQHQGGANHQQGKRARRGHRGAFGVAHDHDALHEDHYRGDSRVGRRDAGDGGRGAGDARVRG